MKKVINAGIRSIMDRTEASDAFDAGSIPVGCIPILRKKWIMGDKKLKDHLSFKETVQRIKNTTKDDLLWFKEWITDYGKIILPLMLLILVSATVVVSLNAREKVDVAAQEALEVLEETKAEVNEIQETNFDEDMYPEINALIYKYYEALEMADIDTLIEIQSTVTSTETIRLTKMSEYIDRYENIHVYTKPGPFQDTYIAYAYSEVYLAGRDDYTPGLQAFYICMDEFGGYYINNSELTKEEALYIENVSQQADVVDLKNSVNVSYAKIMEENTELSEYWASISVEIDLAVGEQLSLEAQLLAQLEEAMQETEEGSDTKEDEEKKPEIIRVRVVESVNVRKSDSVGADKLGSAKAGDTFVLLEAMANGWSRISYEGSEGYIKSEYLEELEDISAIETAGTLIVNTDSLNVRAEPNQTSTKLGVLLEGQIIELVEYVDDWCKIKFNGQIAYVKAEFVKEQ